jgi:hypothetical protein
MESCAPQVCRLNRELSAAIAQARPSSQPILSGEVSAPPLDPIERESNLKTFHPFPELPIELRLKIWNFARPRALKAHIDINGHLCTTTPPPDTFRVNHESRTETVKYYPKPFLHYGDEDAPALHRHFFDPNVDVVEFIDRSLLASWADSVISTPSRSSSTPIRDDLSCIQMAKFVVNEWTNATLWWRLVANESAHFADYEDLKKSDFFGLRGLRELTIAGGGNNRRVRWERMNAKKGLVKYFEELEKYDAELSIPEIECLAGTGERGNGTAKSI